MERRLTIFLAIGVICLGFIVLVGQAVKVGV